MQLLSSSKWGGLSSMSDQYYIYCPVWYDKSCWKLHIKPRKKTYNFCYSTVSVEVVNHLSWCDHWPSHIKDFKNDSIFSWRLGLCEYHYDRLVGLRIVVTITDSVVSGLCCTIMTDSVVSGLCSYHNDWHGGLRIVGLPVWLTQWSQDFGVTSMTWWSQDYVVTILTYSVV